MNEKGLLERVAGERLWIEPGGDSRLLPPGMPEQKKDAHSQQGRRRAPEQPDHTKRGCIPHNTSPVAMLSGPRHDAGPPDQPAHPACGYQCQADQRHLASRSR